MRVKSIHSKAEIEAFLRHNTWLHLYAIGDLDDFFWQHTTWYGFKDSHALTQLVLLYTGSTLPVLLGMSDNPTNSMQALLQDIIPFLPRRFYAHLNENGATVFAHDYNIQSHGVHYKMALVNPVRLAAADVSMVMPLAVSDAQEVEAFYHASYPGNWFNPRMLETGYYYGIRRDEELVSIAGVHVYSPHYKIAALGNVVTHPHFRGHGLGTAVCAKLCQALLQRVDHVGLNVKADNASAIAVYERLGFRRIATYEEYLLELALRS